MKLLLLVVGNAVVLLALLRWVQQQRRAPDLGPFLLPLLGLRLLAALFSTLRPSEDAGYYHAWSGHLAEQLWAEPLGWLQMLAGNEFSFGGRSLVFHGYSNTFFFLKLLSALSWLTGDFFVLKALYLALAAGMAVWTLARVLTRLFPATWGAALLALFWPSALYWSSGITKESLLLAGCCLLLAGALRLLYRPAGTGWLGWAGLALLGAWLSFQMRFFFGGALLGMLLALALVRLAQQLAGGGLRRRWQMLLFAGTLLAGAWAAGQVSPVFRFNKFASQLTRTYTKLQQKSVGRPHVALPELAPTAESMLRHAPKAVASTLYRPLAWEGDSVFYGFAALENLFLLLLNGLACWDWARRRWAPLPFALALLLFAYCLSMAALIGLSTPNLGTLSRYRAAWLPLLVYLLAAQPTVAGALLRLRGRLGRRG